MAVATWQQVAVALGRPADFGADQQAQITWWLNGVELLIKKRFGDVDDLDQDNLVYVEVEAVAAKVPPKGTAGESSVTVSVDDGSVTRRWEKSPVTDGDITDEWWGLLSPVYATGTFTIRPWPARQCSLDSWGCW
jgi:hypothetical protein